MLGLYGRWLLMYKRVRRLGWRLGGARFIRVIFKYMGNSTSNRGLKPMFSENQENWHRGS